MNDRHFQIKKFLIRCVLSACHLINLSITEIGPQTNGTFGTDTHENLFSAKILFLKFFSHNIV
jgi:hypothetical protein